MPPKYKVYDYSKFLFMVDTVKIYNKKATKESKSNYSYFKKAYGKLYKEDQKLERIYSKMHAKLKLNHEKCLDYVDARNEKLESQNELLETKVNKLKLKSSDVSFKKDALAVKYLTDSLNVLVSNFKAQKMKWVKATEATYLQPLIDTMLYSRYLFRIRNMLVERN